MDGIALVMIGVLVFLAGIFLFFTSSYSLAGTWLGITAFFGGLALMLIGAVLDNKRHKK